MTKASANFSINSRHFVLTARQAHSLPNLICSLFHQMGLAMELVIKRGEEE
jgi:hypothetical protein